ncbi:lipase family protein [Nocardioides sp.]|uniref:lipase family protein n=1 Tax=Nocardioides sp. TaxID=35761 RepID=UPI00351618FB
MRPTLPRLLRTTHPTNPARGRRRRWRHALPITGPIGLATLLLVLGLSSLPDLRTTEGEVRTAPRVGATNPDTDPFYRSGRDLRGLAPGTILRSRRVTLAALTLVPTGVTATQVLYRTTDQIGRPALAVATIIRPRAARAHRLVSYQTFYDGLAGRCAPSYYLQGGTPPLASGVIDAALLTSYLSLGYTVVTADYETTEHHYTAGQGSGRATLDGIRAALHRLDARPARTRVAMVGYSGGAIASAFAAEQAARYAPELDLVGTAVGGPPVSLAHTLRYIDGSPTWTGTLPYALVGLARGFGVDLRPHLTPLGRTEFADAGRGCLNPVGVYGMTDLFKARDPYAIPVLRRMLATVTMGRTAPDHPVLLGVGNYDGRGDGVMIARDTRRLAASYCARGTRTQFHEYTGLDHYGAITRFSADALAFVQARLEDRRVPTTCR